jgi:hypothetical protein
MKNPAPDDLTAKQLKGLAAIISNPTLTAAARAAKVSERTIRRWMRDPIFRRVLRREVSDHYCIGVAKLEQAAAAAADTLRGILDDPDASAGERISAALGVLRLGWKAAAVGLAEELDELAVNRLD